MMGIRHNTEVWELMPRRLSTPRSHRQTMEQILIPMVRALREKAGSIAVTLRGLMVTSQGPRVLEFNARL